MVDHPAGTAAARDNGGGDRRVRAAVGAPPRGRDIPRPAGHAGYGRNTHSQPQHAERLDQCRLRGLGLHNSRLGSGRGDDSRLQLRVEEPVP